MNYFLLCRSFRYFQFRDEIWHNFDTFAVFSLFSFLDQIDPGSDLIRDFPTVDCHDLASKLAHS